MEVVDGPLEVVFTGYSGCESRCGCAIIHTRMLSPARCVLLTESPNNPGTSVTCAGAALATQIYGADAFKGVFKGVSPEDICWIGHTPPEPQARPALKRSLALIRMDWHEDQSRFGRSGYLPRGWVPFGATALPGPEFDHLKMTVESVALEIEAFLGVPSDDGFYG